jgi:DNA polymerase (family 10)
VIAAPITNEEFAQQFDEVADLLGLQDANPFRVRASRNAARMIRRHGQSMGDLVAKGADLTELPGIGEDLAGKIKETVKRGKSAILDQLHRQVPAFLVELLNIPRVEPKRALLLWHKLRIRSREQLLRAARDGRLAGVKGLYQLALINIHWPIGGCRWR